MHSSPLFVVSPHFDDAVFSCGMVLAAHPGSTVCTVFAGAPPLAMSTSWDRSAGFLHSDAAIEARRREDDRALALIGARGLRLPFLDAQYENPPPARAVGEALLQAWDTCGRPPVVAPLGLYHSDHVLVSDACCALLEAGRLPGLTLYEDALYRRIRHVLRERREALARRGLRLQAAAPGDCFAEPPVPGAASRKWRSVRAYRSQLRALADAHPNDLVEPERYWRLSVAPLGYARRVRA
jgi:LmbE family N-acetylglucosaminyl deacetylase